ncbi:MAG: hypothetical protein QW432_07195 [Desulfurococcaceae archaeon]
MPVGVFMNLGRTLSTSLGTPGKGLPAKKFSWNGYRCPCRM